MSNFRFAAIFMQKRKQLNVTQEDIARYVGISRAAVSKWEKGQSYPDISLLPKLAAYFNVSIDDLLGYEPQMTEQRILKTYADLAAKFTKLPYEEVDKQIEELVKEYFSCFPLLLKMALLYANYFNLAQNKEEATEKIQSLCIRVKEFSGDYKLVNEATIIEALSYILQEEPQKVLALLGEDAKVQLGAEQLIAAAQTMLGETEKAKEIYQVNQYQYLLGMLGNASEMLMLEIANATYFEQIVTRVEAVLDTFQIEKLNVNTALVFYLRAASGFAVQNRTEEALRCIARYVKICMHMDFPVRITGDAYFYLLEDWVKREVILNAQSPRDDESIKKSLYESVVGNPMFESLKEHAQFKSLVTNLQHHLRIGG
ncbi:helix-turn-helix domain-containing protein [Solibacillus sp. MA9]|uniref:Helix-turn-helix domain-containing protein n=1 Tax=Solibacillus palustris TaxID=2908203 RepID=A0ABS9UI02_9BACL|nr:XRE family transcriptional regulator [Solibacillus sp. MA9]MCH7323775.1 helix-turn-helix domain-containing protein [Solibacillus sp. MA9]